LPGGISRRCRRDKERFVSAVSRGVRSAFRSPARTVAIVVILGLSIGLSFVMLVGHKSVQNKINATLASVGNTVNIAPVGYASGGTGYLTTAQLSNVAHLPYVVDLDEALPGSLSAGGAADQSAGAGQTLLPSSPGEPVSVVGTNEPTDPANVGASTLKILVGHVIDGTGDSDDAMVSTTTAKRNHLKAGSTFTAYGAVLTVKAIFDSDTDTGNDTVIVPLATQQRLTHHDNDVASAVATADSLTHLSDVTGEITIALGPAADVTSDIAQASQALAPLNSVKSLSLYSLSGAVAAAAIISFLIMVMIVRERKREVGILKAIGAPNGLIMYQFMTEALTFSVLGGAAGLLAGALAANSITSRLVSGSGHSHSPGSPTAGQNPALQHLSQVHATATAPEVLIGLAGILLIAAFGSASASYLISKIQPAEALRSE
jgi:putative ABC transport system permease protein